MKYRSYFSGQYFLRKTWFFPKWTSSISQMLYFCFHLKYRSYFSGQCILEYIWIFQKVILESCDQTFQDIFLRNDDGNREMKFWVTNLRLLTLECGINMLVLLLIFKLFSQQHALILHSIFIHSNIFDQKYPEFMFFRLQYVHFWPLILVSIKFSRRHVYYFHKLFQQACLFRQARLFRTLEYVKCSKFLYVNFS